MFTTPNPTTNLLHRVERALFGSLPDAVRRNARVELLSSLAYGVFFAGTLAFLPAVLRRQGATEAQLALYVTLSYAGQLLSPLSVTLARGRPAMATASFFWAISRSVFLLSLVVSNVEGLLLLASIFWLAETLPSPAYAQIMQECYPARFRGRAMAGVRIGMTLAILAATPLVGLALDRFGNGPLHGVSALFGVIAVIVMAYMRPLSGSVRPPASIPLRGMLQIVRQDRTFLKYLATMTVYGLGGVMALPLYPIVQISRLQLSYTQIGYLGLVQSAFWLAGFAFWGRLLDQRGPIWLLKAALLLAAVVPFMYSIASNVWFLIPAFIAQGLLQGAFELGATNAGIGLANQGRVLEYTALQTATLGLRGMIAPFVGAALLRAGMPIAWVFIISTLLVFVSFVMIASVRPLDQEPHSEP